MILVLIVILVTIGDIKTDGDNIHISIDGISGNQSLERLPFKDIHLHISGKKKSNGVFDRPLTERGLLDERRRKRSCKLKKRCGRKRKCKNTYICKNCRCGRKPKRTVGFQVSRIKTCPNCKKLPFLCQKCIL